MKRLLLLAPIGLLILLGGGAYLYLSEEPFSRNSGDDTELSPPVDLCDSIVLDGLLEVTPSDFSQWEVIKELSKVEMEDEESPRARCAARSEAQDSRENRLEIVANYAGENQSWEPSDSRFTWSDDNFTYATNINDSGDLVSIGLLEESNLDVQITCVCSGSIDSATYDEELSRAFLDLAEQIVELSRSK